MSEKRFIMVKSIENLYALVDKERKDTEQILLLSLHKEQVSDVADLLNEQQATIQSLQKDIIEMSDSHQSYIEMESETKSKVNDTIRTQRREIRKLSKENDKLKELIKENVFGKYGEGSLADLKFKAIAYDDIVKLETSDESEPKVVVVCKQGKKENVISFCQMFIPFGIAYEIVEMIDDE